MTGRSEDWEGIESVVIRCEKPAVGRSVRSVITFSAEVGGLLQVWYLAYIHNSYLYRLVGRRDSRAFLFRWISETRVTLWRDWVLSAMGKSMARRVVRVA